MVRVHFVRDYFIITIPDFFLSDSQIEESSDEENSVEDGDTIDPEELKTVFKNEFRLTDERAVSAKKRYLLHLTNSKYWL